VFAARHPPPAGTGPVPWEEGEGGGAISRGPGPWCTSATQTGAGPPRPATWPPRRSGGGGLRRITRRKEGGTSADPSSRVDGGGRQAGAHMTSWRAKSTGVPRRKKIPNNNEWNASAAMSKRIAAQRQKIQKKTGAGAEDGSGTFALMRRMCWRPITNTKWRFCFPGGPLPRRPRGWDGGWIRGSGGTESLGRD